MRTKDTIAKLAARNESAQAALRRHLSSFGGCDGPEGRKLKLAAARAYRRLMECAQRIIKA